MSDRDIVAELRRLYAEATGDDPRPWERMEKHDRVLGHVIYHGDPLNEGVGVAFTLRAADLIVAMHSHLPALLDIAEAVAAQDNPHTVAVPGSDGDRRCEWCGGWREGSRKQHTPDCPYRRARELCGMEQDGEG